ncbi:DUF5615 family PIN-like protein [Micromonospora coriariae]|uniref:DUF5615 family PIN-like protein n=1 Tax=Micromonospora coriariae TaxID=285665 RepID=UPI00156117E8
MRFLVDNNLSPKVAAGLTVAGHEATHVREYGMSAAPDEKVMAKALADRSVDPAGSPDQRAPGRADGGNHPRQPAAGAGRP